VQLRIERDTGEGAGSALPGKTSVTPKAPLGLLRLRFEEQDGKIPVWVEADYRFASWSVLLNGNQSDLHSHELAARSGIWLVGASEPNDTRVGLRAGAALLRMAELEGDGSDGAAPGFALVPQMTGQVGGELQIGGELVRGTLLSDFGVGGTLWNSASEARLGLRLGERAQLSLLSGLDLRRGEYQLDGSLASGTRSQRVLATNVGLAFSVR
jgi:hypothetical protein